jgi:AcrR family transcriptional regulator
VVQILGRTAGLPPKDARRAEILRRAADAFREHGFHGAAMRDIAKALEMTPGNLYYYFEGKEDLLYACQKTALTTLLSAARRIAASPVSAAAKVTEIATAHVLCLLEETGGSAAHLEFRALPGERRAEIAAERDGYEGLVREMIEEGIAAGDFRPVDPKLATLAMLGTLNSTVVWWRPDGPRRPKEIAETFAALIVGGLTR